MTDPRDYQRVAHGGSEATRDLIWRAQYESRNFSFEAYGWSEDDARTAMLRLLLAHAVEYGLAALWYDVDDIAIAERVIGSGYRDGEPVA